MSAPGQGVTARLVAFFLANPSEELTCADIAAKFGCSRETARIAVCHARKELPLERVLVFRLKESR
jgi:DNA-directed RNA polymerase specialized sigma24 family protein